MTAAESGPEPGERRAGRAARPGPRAGRGLAVRDPGALIFAADMYAVQLDQLAALTGDARARRRRRRPSGARSGYAQTARLSPLAQDWLWVTRQGLAACGLAYSPARPALSRLAHIRAVTAVRLSLEGTSGYLVAAAYWRCERRIRARHGVGLRQHLPDAEVHWPDAAPVAWVEASAGAVEARSSRPRQRRGQPPRSCGRSSRRTGDYGCLAADAAVPGPPGTARPRAVPQCAPPPRARHGAARAGLARPRSPHASRFATCRRALRLSRAPLPRRHPLSPRRHPLSPAAIRSPPPPSALLRRHPLSSAAIRSPRRPAEHIPRFGQIVSVFNAFCPPKVGKRACLAAQSRRRQSPTARKAAPGTGCR